MASPGFRLTFEMSKKITRADYGKDFGKANPKEVAKWLRKKGYASLAEVLERTMSKVEKENNDHSLIGKRTNRSKVTFNR